MRVLSFFSTMTILTLCCTAGAEPAQSLFFSGDSIFVQSDGRVFKDEKWTLTNKDKSTSLYQRTDENFVNKVEIREQGSQNRTIIDIANLQNGESFSHAQLFKISNNKVDEVTECYGKEGCLRINKSTCDHYMNWLKLSSGDQVIELEKKGARLDSAKNKLLDEVRSLSEKNATVEADIKRVAGVTTLRDPLQSVFSHPKRQSTYMASISGLCWAYFWKKGPEEKSSLASPGSNKKPTDSGVR